MSDASFITFDFAEPHFEDTRASATHGRLSQREKKLEHSFVRSHVARFLHAKRRQEASTAFFELKKTTSSTKFKEHNVHTAIVELHQTPLLDTLNTPYGTVEEQKALQFYLERSYLLPREDDGSQGFDFWHVTVPQLAWHSPSLRQALVALSFSNQALLTEGTGDTAEPTISFSLKHQNKAIRTLMTSTPTYLTFVIAATLFRAIDVLRGDMEGIYQHSLATLKMLDAFRLHQNLELLPALAYIRSISQTSFNFFTTDDEHTSTGATDKPKASMASDSAKPTASTWPLEAASGDSYSSSSAAPQEGGLDHVSHVAAISEGDHQDRYLSSLLEYAVACHNIQYANEMLKKSESTEELPLLATPRPFLMHLAHTFCNNAKWVYDQWSSVSYLQQYLDEDLTKRFVDFRIHLEDGHPQYITFDTDCPFPGKYPLSTFSETVDEFAFRAGISEAKTGPSPSKISEYSRDPVEELFTRLGNTGNLFLANTAGTDPQLRRDILGLTEVATSTFM